MKRIVASILAIVMFMMCFAACSDGTQNLESDGITEIPVTNLPETEPEVTEPKATEPEATEPEATEPEVTEPKATEPEATEPEVTEPEVTEPEVTEPEVTEPEATEPEVTEPEVTEPEATEPEATEPEATEPEVTEPEVTEPEVTEPEVTEPEKKKVNRTPAWLLRILGKLNDSEEPEVTEPEETEPEVTEPEETKPEETEPEETEPEVTEPEETKPEETEPEEPGEPEDFVYDRVIIIGVDGGGAFFKDTDTPNLDEIFADGAVTYTMQTSTPSISAQSWGALLHGVTPEFHRLTNSVAGSVPYDPDSQYPSFFRVVREAFPDAELSSFCNWNPINVGIIENGLGVIKETASDDGVLTDMIVDYLDENDPKLLFVQFDNCDGAGHGSGYGSERHLEQITTTDGYIGRIYAKLEERGMAENTLFIVTADHGGTPGGSHGGSTPEEMNIMFAVVGKSVIPGGSITSMDEHGDDDDPQIRDTAAIVLHAFGLELPETWTATVPGDTFLGVEAVVRPEGKIIYEHGHRTHENEDTPASDSGKYITDALGADRIISYITFDNTIDDAMGGTTSSGGKLYFVEGYYGQGSEMSDGYVEIEDFAPGMNSFSVAMWFKTSGIPDGDPCLVSNKSWASGNNPGFVLSLRQNDVDFNFGNGSNRMDKNWLLPVDYVNGWVHVILSVDREENTVSLAYDFGDLVSVDITDELAEAVFDGISGLVIGQDGTKEYNYSLSAVLDDVILIDGALTESDVAALAAYYGVAN